jgi:alpha-L-rhamnosidase
VRALAFNLFTENLKPKIAKKLVERIEDKNRHLFTGFLSTPFLLSVLSDAGETDLAYEVLLKEDSPSWIYAINKGATTIWEDWEGVSEEGVPTASQNHYSKGAVASWFFEYICGIQMDPEVPAYKHFFLRPEPGGGLTHARAIYHSKYGEILSSWQKSDSMITYTFTVPANTSASVRLIDVKEFSSERDLRNIKQDQHVLSFDLMSGTHSIKVVSA